MSANNIPDDQQGPSPTSADPGQSVLPGAATPPLSQPAGPLSPSGPPPDPFRPSERPDEPVTATPQMLIPDPQDDYLLALYRERPSSELLAMIERVRRGIR